LRPDAGLIRNIASFGEDTEGNLYIVDYGENVLVSDGEIFRLTGGGDYLPSTTTVNFETGETSQTFSVEVLGDRLPEDNETLLASLSNPINAMILRAQAVGTILNDDPPEVESVVVNQGDVQRSIVDEVVVTFNALVQFDEVGGSPFVFQNLDTLANVEYVSNVSNSSGKTVVSFQFVPGASVLQRGSATPTLADGNYALRMDGGRVNLAGVSLDGDSDGVGGGDYLFVDQFFRKFGDINANGVVELTDFARFRGVFGTTLGEPAYLDGFDSDGDGTIGLPDFADFRDNFGS
jgi:hypothetical protein